MLFPSQVCYYCGGRHRTMIAEVRCQDAREQSYDEIEEVYSEDLRNTQGFMDALFDVLSGDLDRLDGLVDDPPC